MDMEGLLPFKNKQKTESTTDRICNSDKKANSPHNNSWGQVAPGLPGHSELESGYGWVFSVVSATATVTGTECSCTSVVGGDDTVCIPRARAALRTGSPAHLRPTCSVVTELSFSGSRKVFTMTCARNTHLGDRPLEKFIPKRLSSGRRFGGICQWLGWLTSFWHNSGRHTGDL